MPTSNSHPGEEESRPLLHSPTIAREHLYAPRNKGVLRRVAAAGLALVLIAGVATSGFFLGRQVHSGEDPIDATYVNWKPCQEKFYCGKLRVPLDHKDPEGEQITLALIKLPASNKPSLGSLFVNPGGPGGSGVEFVQRAGDDLHKIYDGRYDLVGFDPRGIGQSNPVRCFPDANTHRLFELPSQHIDFDVPGSYEADFARAQVLAGLCGKNAARILAHMTTADVARDMDLMRKAEKQEYLHYWGFSYGTILGQTYANMFPHNIGQFIIDGVASALSWAEGHDFGFIPNTTNAEWVTHLYEVYDKFAASCEAAGPSRCALARDSEKHSVSKRLKNLRANLKLHPLITTDAEVAGVVTHETFDAASFRLVYIPHAWPKYALAFAAAEKGNGTLLQNLVVKKPEELCPRFDSPDIESTLGVYCSDATPKPANLTYVREQAEVAVRKYPFVGQMMAGVINACAVWPKVGESRYTGPWTAKTNNKILILGNTFDPVTPIESAELAASLLPNSVLVRHHGYGHCSNAQPSKCTNEVIRRYLVDKKAPKEAVTECYADLEPFMEGEVNALSLDAGEARESVADVLADAWKPFF
ncbi:Alpha/Beta hydrolase protein [Fimicolochytrium jonesii]|uniref:Alpha/Beta hydrolase protein n=1 Tax=Fimicolochytrium jonesii TaxID=1396493 RepID=UPI0022FEBE8A|nr:Alpha/Beta hydrolase protein [Fimicolochytrium jonesii]KAI8816137.1 Alpha/Beta hydrolase protein [Fimicolochytrium jonesii]